MSFLARRYCIGFLALLPVCAISPPALAQEADAANSILSRTNEPLTPSQQAIVDGLKASSEASAVRVLRILGVVADLLTDNDSNLLMPISGGRDVLLVRTMPPAKTEEGAITWFGQTVETGERERA